MNQNEMKKQLRQQVMPRLELILDVADDIIRGQQKEGYQEEPTLHDKMSLGLMMMQMFTGDSSAKVQAMTKKLDELERKLEEAEASIPPNPDYAEIRPIWNEILDRESIDVEVWDDLDRLLTGTQEGQALLFSLCWMAYARNQREGEPPSAS